MLSNYQNTRTGKKSPKSSNYDSSHIRLLLTFDLPALDPWQLKKSIFDLMPVITVYFYPILIKLADNQYRQKISDVFKIWLGQTLELKTCLNLPERLILNLGSGNSLRDSVIMAPSLKCFKSRLNSHWKGKKHSYKFNPWCYISGSKPRDCYKNAPTEAV